MYLQVHRLSVELAGAVGCRGCAVDANDLARGVKGVDRRMVILLNRDVRRADELPTAVRASPNVGIALEVAGTLRTMEFSTFIPRHCGCCPWQ